MNYPVNTMKTTLLALMLMAVAMISAQAHPGHGLFEQGFLHAVSSAYHVALMAGLGLLLAAGAQVARHPRARLALRSTGAALVALAAVLWVL
jgi:hypothetical protein